MHFGGSNGENLLLPGMGCKIPTGPLGRAGVLIVCITGMGSPLVIMGVTPCIGLKEVRGARTGMVGIMGTFAMDPIPEETNTVNG